MTKLPRRDCLSGMPSHSLNGQCAHFIAVRVSSLAQPAAGLFRARRGPRVNSQKRDYGGRVARRRLDLTLLAA